MHRKDDRTNRNARVRGRRVWIIALNLCLAAMLLAAWPLGVLAQEAPPATSSTSTTTAMASSSSGNAAANSESGESGGTSQPGNAPAPGSFLESGASSGDAPAGEESAAGGASSGGAPAGDASAAGGASPDSAPAAHSVTAFAALDEAVRSQSVESGAKQAALALPAAFFATVDGIEHTEIPGVAWVCAAYDDETGMTADEYEWTAVLPEGYTPAAAEGGAAPALPRIVVLVDGGALLAPESTGSELVAQLNALNFDARLDGSTVTVRNKAGFDPVVIDTPAAANCGTFTVDAGVTVDWRANATLVAKNSGFAFKGSEGSVVMSAGNISFIGSKNNAGALDVDVQSFAMTGGSIRATDTYDVGVSVGPGVRSVDVCGTAVITGPVSVDVLPGNEVPVKVYGSAKIDFTRAKNVDIYGSAQVGRIVTAFVGGLLKIHGDARVGNAEGGIIALNGPAIAIYERAVVESSGGPFPAIRANGGSLDIYDDARVTSTIDARPIVDVDGTTNIYGNAVVDTAGDSCTAVLSDGPLNIYGNAAVRATGFEGTAVYSRNSTLDIYGNAVVEAAELATAALLVAKGTLNVSGNAVVQGTGENCTAFWGTGTLNFYGDALVRAAGAAGTGIAFYAGDGTAVIGENARIEAAGKAASGIVIEDADVTVRGNAAVTASAADADMSAVRLDGTGSFALEDDAVVAAATPGADAIYAGDDASGAITIAGGRVTAAGGAAIRSLFSTTAKAVTGAGGRVQAADGAIASGGAVNITGGTVEGAGNTHVVESNAGITMAGGTVRQIAGNGAAVLYAGEGDIAMTGGRVLCHAGGGAAIAVDKAAQSIAVSGGVVYGRGETTDALFATGGGPVPTAGGDALLVARALESPQDAYHHNTGTDLAVRHSPGAAGDCAWQRKGPRGDYLHGIRYDVNGTNTGFFEVPRVTVTVPPDAAQNDIQLPGGGKAVAGEPFAFAAVGHSRGEAPHVVGDECYVPDSWQLLAADGRVAAEGRFGADAPYTGSFTVEQPGSYTLSVRYRLERWDGGAWVDVNMPDTKTTALVFEGGGGSGGSSSSSGSAGSLGGGVSPSAAGGGASPKTGDEGNWPLWVGLGAVALAVLCLLVAVRRGRRGADN